MTVATSRLESLLLNASLILGTLGVLAVTMEVGLRVAGFSNVAYHRPDDRLGLRLTANAHGHFTAEGDADVRINAAGFRDLDRAEKKPAGVFRIAVLGDSYIEALQVDLDDTFTAQLERRLSGCGAFAGQRVEVLNFGVSSYGTAQQLLTFREHSSRYAPDLVIAAVFTGNDVRNNSRELEPDKLRPFFVVEGGALVEDRSFAQSDEFRRRTNALRALLDGLRVSRIVQGGYYLKDRLGSRAASPAGPRNDAAAFEAGIDNAVYGEPKTPAWREAWEVTDRLIVQLENDVRAAGARLLVVTLSSGIQVHPDPQVRRQFEAAAEGRDVTYPDRRIEAAASRHGIETVLLAPQLRKLAERDKVFFHGFPNTRMGTGHWNAAGHRAAADLAAARLCRRRDAAVAAP